MNKKLTLMKKIILSIAMFSTIYFTSCSNDDNVASQQCRTCELDALIAVITSEYCDNGDGTMTVTTQGESEIVDLEGQTFDATISALEQIGATCN